MKKGYTLIQLLVTLAIIVVLSGVILTSASSIRSKSRDQRRIVDMTQYKVALAHYIEANNQYPPGCTWQDFACLQNILKTGGYMGDPPQGPGFVLADAGTFLITSGYHYDRWCNTPELGGGPLKYRLWSTTENPQKVLQYNWWAGNFVGVTNCIDPS